MKGRKLVSQELLPVFASKNLRLTSSLQETAASPWAFLALQVYTPPSKLQGLRISSEQMPWLEICRNLGSSPMIIWFFNHSILGWEEKRHLYMSVLSDGAICDTSYVGFFLDLFLFFYIITRAGVWLADILFRKGCARWKLGSEVTKIFSWPEVCAALGFGDVLSARISSPTVCFMQGDPGYWISPQLMTFWTARIGQSLLMCAICAASYDKFSK